MEKSPIYVVANNIRSLANVGLFFRISEAANIEKLYLTGITGHPEIEKDIRLTYQIEKDENKINKTAIKTVQNVPWEYIKEPLEIIKSLKEKNVAIVSIEQTPNSVSIWNAKFRFPVCLVFGHERLGVDKNILQKSDLIVEIPMFGKGKSLNVTTAYGITIFEVLRQVI